MRQRAVLSEHALLLGHRHAAAGLCIAWRRIGRAKPESTDAQPGTGGTEARRGGKAYSAASQPSRSRRIPAAAAFARAAAQAAAGSTRGMDVRYGEGATDCDRARRPAVGRSFDDGTYPDIG